jgi:hypothetical protein
MVSSPQEIKRKGIQNKRCLAQQRASFSVRPEHLWHWHAIDTPKMKALSY